MAGPVGRHTAYDSEHSHDGPFDRSSPYPFQDPAEPGLEPVQQTPGPDKLPGPDPQPGENEGPSEQNREHPKGCPSEDKYQPQAEHSGTETVVRHLVAAERLAPWAAIRQTWGSSPGCPDEASRVDATSDPSWRAQWYHHLRNHLSLLAERPPEVRCCPGGISPAHLDRLETGQVRGGRCICPGSRWLALPIRAMRADPADRGGPAHPGTPDAARRPALSPRRPQRTGARRSSCTTHGRGRDHPAPSRPTRPWRSRPAPDPV